MQLELNGEPPPDPREGYPGRTRTYCLGIKVNMELDIITWLKQKHYEGEAIA